MYTWFNINNITCEFVNICIFYMCIIDNVYVFLSIIKTELFIIALFYRRLVSLL